MVITNGLYNGMYDDIHVCMVKCIQSVWLHASLPSKMGIWRYQAQRARSSLFLAPLGPARAQVSTRSLMNFPNDEG